jgi:hypothetical protein
MSDRLRHLVAPNICDASDFTSPATTEKPFPIRPLNSFNRSVESQETGKRSACPERCELRPQIMIPLF